MDGENNGGSNKKAAFIKTAAAVAIAFAVLGVILIFPVMAVFLAVVFVIVLVIVFCAKFAFGINFNDSSESLNNMAAASDITDIDDIKSLVSVPLPFAVADGNKRIILYNDEFKGLINFETYGRTLNEVFGKFDVGAYTQFFDIGDMPYDVFCGNIPNKKNGGVMYTICLVNVFEREALKRDLRNKKTILGLIYLDNYEEVTESADDAQVPLLTALIDRKINNYISGFGGVVKNFEKDRYIFVLTNEALNNAKEKKFEITNTVKETKVGDHIPVTLSIGIGISGGGLDASMKNAREAIELALGRGGDQVLIKDDEKYQFFGGKSGEVSHNAKIRARVKADALEGLINDASNVFIMGHRMPDYDALGAAAGMARIVRSLGKTPYIVLDYAPKGITPVYNAVLSCEENRGIFIKGRDALELYDDRSLLIVVDTYRPSLVENREVLNGIKKIVVFDHHRKSAEYIENAVLTYHEPYASSTCELVTEVIRHMGDKVRLKPAEADVILSGIILDTKSFSVRANTVTFESAAYLRRNGADSIRVKEFFRNDFEDFKIKSETVGSAEIYKGGIVIAKCGYETEGVSIICAQAADELMEINGVKASVVISKIYGKIYISARSLGDVNVQVLMEKIGGGGHRTMAGCQFENMDIDEALEKVKLAVDEYLKEEE